MDSILSAVWYTCVPWALVGAGSLLLLLGGRGELDGITRPLRDPAKVITWVQGFRLTMIGLALAGTAPAGCSTRPGLTCSRWPSA